MSKDLALLVADKNMEGALRGLLSRPKSLGLREIAFDLYVHPERDHGCLLRSHHFLRPFSHQYAHALVLLDRDGCGQESVDRATLERQVEDHLAASGWADRAAAIVIDPELEIWVWSDSPHIATALGWASDGPGAQWTRPALIRLHAGRRERVFPWSRRLAVWRERRFQRLA